MPIKKTSLATLFKVFGAFNKKGKHILQISKEINMTPSHLYGKINKNDFAGLIVMQKVGRKKIVYLTKKGEIAKKLLKKLQSL